MSHADGPALLIALGLFIGIPLIVIIINGLSMRRHRTNAWCALSIMVVCLAIIIHTFAVLGIQTTHIPIKVVRSLYFSSAGLMILSAALAIVGLIRRAMRRRYTRGKWRATVALLLDATFLTFFFMNVIEGEQQDVAWKKLMQTNTPPGALVSNEAWNFRIQPPPEWSRINEAPLGPDVRMAFNRSHPELYCTVTAQDFPEGLESLAAAMNEIKRLASMDGKVEVVAEDEKEERDLTFRTMEIRSQKRAGNLFFVHWITRDGNTLYHIRTWGDDSHMPLIRQEAQKIAEGFEIIQRRRAPAPKPPVASIDTIPLPAARLSSYISAPPSHLYPHSL